MIKFTIPLAPISKKNSQRIMINKRTGKPFIMPSAVYKQYEKEAALYVPRGVVIDKPVNIKCLFYMPTRRKCDLTNLLEAIDDVLVKTGLLTDDNFTIIESHDGSRVYYDKENPRTEIYIEDSAERTEALYLCDRNKCSNCCYPECAYTTDLKHAKSFIFRGGGVYAERKINSKEKERLYFYED